MPKKAGKRKRIVRSAKHMQGDGLGDWVNKAVNAGKSVYNWAKTNKPITRINQFAKDLNIPVSSIPGVGTYIQKGLDLGTQAGLGKKKKHHIRGAGLPRIVV